MAAERKQHRISSVLTRVASGFCTFILAVVLSTHFNPLGPDISPRNLASQNPIVIATLQVLPEQAEKLALASSEGKLQVVVRNSAG